MLKNLKNIFMEWVSPPPPHHPMLIVVNNIIYLFCEKLECLENNNY